jgi:hypothetical protein
MSNPKIPFPFTAGEHMLSANFRNALSKCRGKAGVRIAGECSADPWLGQN